MLRYFNLFSNCIPTKGFKNAILCDLQLNRYIQIHDEIYSLLENSIQLDFEHLKNVYSIDDLNELYSYFEYLENEGYGKFTTFKFEFPKLELDFETPFKINNAILDYNNESKYDIKNALNRLSETSCVAVQIRYFDFTHLTKLIPILDAHSKTDINSLELVLKGLNSFDYNEITKLFIKFSKLRKLVVFNRPHFITKKVSDENNEYGYLFELMDNLNSADDCGNVNKDLFFANIDSYTEALGFNSCLNKKISIDVDGEIKNCPSFKTGFGKFNVGTSFDTIIKLDSFNSFWKINKDKVEICKDCEYRYICTDCRALLKDPKNQLSKPLKCNYNPYQGVWEN
jgi:SPASM domain peptide maturase of grasp-with-spasm system